MKLRQHWENDQDPQTQEKGHVRNQEEGSQSQNKHIGPPDMQMTEQNKTKQTKNLQFFFYSIPGMKYT